MRLRLAVLLIDVSNKSHTIYADKSGENTKRSAPRAEGPDIPYLFKLKSQYILFFIKDKNSQSFFGKCFWTFINVLFYIPERLLSEKTFTNSAESIMV